MKLAVYATALCVLITTSSAYAECYGDAADQYGCGNTLVAQGRSVGTLERFGGSNDGPIIIDNGGYGRSASPYDVFSPEDERRMYRNLVMDSGTRNMSRGYGNRSIRSNSRALRFFRGRRIGGAFRR